VDPLVGSYTLGEDLTHLARLDIRKIGTGYEAIVTRLYGEPTAVVVSVTGTSVLLTGNVVVLTASGCAGGERAWTSVDIPRTADGRLGSPPVFGVTDTFPRSSEFIGPCCGVIDDVITTTPTPPLTPDRTPPWASAAVISPVLPGGPVPWDPISVSVSEGVPASQLSTTASLVLAGTTAPLDVTWKIVPSPVDASWNAFVKEEGHVTDWDEVAGKSLQFITSPGLTDPSGNTSVGYTFAPFAFLNIGKPAAAFDFDGPVTLATWGSTRLVTGGTADAAVCESGGCAILDPLAPGIAGRLATSGSASEVHVRYRVLFAFDAAYPSPYQGWPPVVELARPGAPAIVQSFAYGTLHDLGTSAGTLHWASDWTTAVFPVPPAPPGAEIGFRIWSATTTPCFPDARLVIESITTG
jgi:hypothetical protein